MPSQDWWIVFKTKKEGNAPKQLTDDLKDVKQGLSGAVEQMTGMNIASLGVAGAITGLGAAVKASVDEFQKYAFEVDDVARTTGMTAEETSKMIQAADDARVSFETIKTAAQFAAKQGISLTTEELAKLSDQYIAIKDPAARATFAMQLFGKNAGPEMTKLLELSGAKIKAMAGEAESAGLVMSQEGVDAAKKYAKALDDLGDKVEGVKLKFGQFVVEGLNNAYDAVDKLTNRDQKLAAVLDDHSKIVAAGTKSYQDYAFEMIRATLQVQGTNKSVEQLKKEFDASGQSVEEVTTRLGFYSAAQYEASQKDLDANNILIRSKQALDEYKKSHDENIAARKEGIGIMQIENEALINGIEPLKAQKAAADKLTASISDLSFEMGGSMTEENKKYNESLKDLTATSTYLKARFDQLNSMKLKAPEGDSAFFGKTKKQIDDLAESWQKLNPSLSGKTKQEVIDLITEYQGLGVGMDANKKKIDELEAEHTKATHVILFNLLQQKLAQDASIDPVKAQEILTGVAQNWGLVGQAEVDATLEAATWDQYLKDHPFATAQELANYIAGIKGKTIDVWIKTHYSSDAAKNSDDLSNGRGNRSNATGGSWFIPAGYGIEGYRFPDGRTASSGEKVTVTPAGKSGGSEKGMFEGAIININNGMDLESLGRWLLKKTSK